MNEFDLEGFIIEAYLQKVEDIGWDRETVEYQENIIILLYKDISNIFIYSGSCKNIFLYVDHSLNTYYKYPKNTYSELIRDSIKLGYKDTLDSLISLSSLELEGRNMGLYRKAFMEQIINKYVFFS